MPNDVADMLGVPELAPPAPVVAQAQTPAAPPPLPNEPDASLLARAAVAEGDQNNPDSWRNVAGVILNRAQKSGMSVANVLSQPGQFEAYQNGHIQSVDPNSPAYKSALQTVQGVKAGDVPYDSFYQPQIVAQRGVTPPFDPSKGTKIGTQLFGSGVYNPPQAPQLADALGLTPDERASLSAQTGPAAASPAGETPGSKQEFNFGPQFGAMSQAAVGRFHQLANDPTRGIDPNASPGSPSLPYYVTPGTTVPTTPGVHWVDVNGDEHINPGGALERVGSGIAGLVQGLGGDTMASAAKLGLGQGDPMMTALSQAQGGPSAFENYEATNQGFAQQQRDYSIRHLGDPYAQAGRFTGQAIPAIAASTVVPELEAPAAFGNAGRMAATGLTNALRGVAATAPGVGANQAPVAQQLATGALAGVAAPLATGALAKGAGAITGMGRTVSPEVAALADVAQNKYGIPLRSGQVMGANGDRAAATADSNLLGSDAKVLANNQAQKQAFMKGMTGSYGDPSGDVSADGLSAARAKVVAPLNDASTRTNISPAAADATQTRISQVIGDAQKVLPDNEVTPLLKMAQAIGDVRGPQGISGESYQALTREGAPLDRLESSDDPNVRFYASQMHDALNDGLAASSAPEDVEAVRNARWQYKNLMTVAKLAPKADVNGFISPALLRGAVGTQFKNQAFAGAGDLGELAQIGQTFMKEPPQSGTAPRLADMLAPFRVGAEAGGATALGGLILQRPETAAAAVGSALAGYGAKAAAQAIKRNKIAGSAENIIARSLPNAPGSALAGVGAAAKSVEVPLSALAGVRGVNAFQGALQPQGAQ